MTDLSPTNTQIDQAAVAHQDFAETIDRMIKEGFDYRSILAGAAAALAQSIMVSAGPAKVPEWFAMQSAMTLHFAESNGKA